MGSSVSAAETAVSAPIRMGHAYWSAQGASELTDLETVLCILNGTSFLEPREPSDPTAVMSAERFLGIDGRVIYLFVGCLHPKLGTIGLIIHSRCVVGRQQGVTKCDSGGLAGRHGAFCHIPPDEVEAALRELTFPGDTSDWWPKFMDEINTSFKEAREYTRGATPDYSGWNDPRSRCIASEDGRSELDRRLWTWEVRLSGSPTVDEFEALVVSHEALKHLEQLRRNGAVIPSEVQILSGTVSATGVS